MSQSGKITSPPHTPIPRLGVFQILKRLAEAGRRRTLHVKAYHASGNEDFGEYVSACMEEEQIGALQELLLYRLATKLGPSLESEIHLRVGVDFSQHVTFERKWRKKRREEGSPPISTDFVLPSFC